MKNVMKFSVSTYSSLSLCAAAFSATNSATSMATCLWSLSTMEIPSHENLVTLEPKVQMQRFLAFWKAQRKQNWVQNCSHSWSLNLQSLHYLKTPIIMLKEPAARRYWWLSWEEWGDWAKIPLIATMKLGLGTWSFGREGEIWNRPAFRNTMEIVSQWFCWITFPFEIHQLEN